MPIIIPTSSSTTSPYSMTLTVQSILDSCTADTMRIFLNDGGSAQTLGIDYVNRVQQELLRFSTWPWMLSGVERFLTQAGQTDYWLSTAGSAPSGSVDTALNLTDIYSIKEGSVFDRTSFRTLFRVEDTQPTRALRFPDASSVTGLPKQWRHDPTNTNILNIYPAPDRRSLYRPIPETPYCSTTSGGALAARIYYVRTTIVDSMGNESTASITAARVFVPASSLLVVNAPQPPITGSADGIAYSRWKVYVSTTEGAETVQNSGSSILTTLNYTEPTLGITTSGATYPTANNIEPLYGYVIEFRYWKQRGLLTSNSDILQIPDIYKDIIVAGTNKYIFRYLSQALGESAGNYSNAASLWESRFEAGKVAMTKDKNLFPKGANFIYPDPIMSARLNTPNQGF